MAQPSIETSARNDAPNRSPASGHIRHSIQTKLSLIFGILALVSLTIGTIVISNLQQVSLDSKKFLEETREARLADELILVLDKLAFISATDPTRMHEHRSVTLVADARSLLQRLYSGPSTGDDPSRREHQESEEGIVEEIEGALETFEQVDQANSAAVEANTARISELASRIRAEMDKEAARAFRDLEVRVERLGVIMLGSAILSVASLAAMFLLVARGFIRPLRELANGASTFGRGELDHRIEIVSRDEVGEVALEFNRMADSLAANRRELEERVERRTEQLLRAARLADLGTFAAGIAHEVNTPLASIASCAEALERRATNGHVDRDEEIEYLQTIAREAYRAHEITARLLEFARKDPGPTGPVALHDPLREASRLLAHAIHLAGLTLDVSADPATPLVRSNHSDLMQVILNLLKNAMDATPSGGTIRASCTRSNGDAILVVEDEGAGVAAEHRARIFDPFFTTKEPGRGTGLGLALVHRIIEDLGGRIELHDGERGGAKFVVRIPSADVMVSE
ncbi:MAG: HAMP domain-containing histidine kinase [Acidobacteria bacterium]|nr:HAMP domain-containing histidine kinase [Acidobacteriota bacterium]